MSRKLKTYLLASLPIAIMTPSGFLLGRLLGLQAADAWVVRFAFGLLGIIAAGVIYWFLKGRQEKEEPGAEVKAGGEFGDIDDVVAAARRRLAASPGTEKASFGTLPLVFVLGPEGSTKTTSVVRSGLEPELLAGETLRGDVPAPTTAANFWYSQRTLLVEAGSRVSEDPARWARLVSFLHPRRIGAVLSGGTQASRVAVVCFPCEELLKAGAPEAVPAVARSLRSRLVEAAQELGIRLPVYVLFTKSDRIPHFDQYVRNFSHEEVRRVLGATLPLSPSDEGAAYGDRQFRRIADAFDGLFRSLALKRLKFLPREAVGERAAQAYEFPREFRKLSDLATRFLVELCRPSQLQVSPFLRGFYFTGVRPVEVADPMSAPAASSMPATEQGRMDATMVFDPSARRPSAPQPAPVTPGTRRVPQWVFLERFFRDVLLRDEVARAVAEGGLRVNAWRRRLLGAAIATGVIVILGLTVSFFSNRGLQNRVAETVQGLRTVVEDDRDGISLAALSRLDSLRTETARLGEWERDGAPWRYRWWLYRGSTLYPDVRRAYFEAFDRLLFASTWRSLAASLDGLPAAPDENSDYGEVYNTLKAYLITTIEPARSTAAFLTPVLDQRWPPRPRVEEERASLARAQFEFYADELARENPYPDLELEGELVNHARRFLREFGQTDPFYRAMVADAERASRPVRFVDAVVRDDYEVPAAFTRDGWAFVQERLADPERLLQTEEWVLGESAAAPDPVALQRALDSRYRADFADHWQTFLEAASIEPFADYADAAVKLGRLAGNDSPIIDLVVLAADNTARESEDLRRRFQPVYVLTPVDSAQDVSIGDPVRNYLNVLTQVQATMEQMTGADPGDRDATEAALGQVRTAKGMLLPVTAGFDLRSVESSPVANSLEDFLEQPVLQAEALLVRNVEEGGAARYNDRVAGFCRDFGRLMALYPFNPSPSAPDATLDDIATVFQPGSSALWNLYNQVLQELMERQGSQYVARADAPVNVLPGFIEFFNRAAAVSRALYPSGSEDPRMDFSFRPRFSDRLDEVTLQIDGQSFQFSPRALTAQAVRWNGRPNRVRVLGRVDGVERTLLGGYEGLWGIFRLFLAAERWEHQGGTQYVVRWSVPIAGAANLLLEAEVDAPSVFADEHLTAMRCPSRAAR